MVCKFLFLFYSLRVAIVQCPGGPIQGKPGKVQLTLLLLGSLDVLFPKEGGHVHEAGLDGVLGSHQLGLVFPHWHVVVLEELVEEVEGLQQESEDGANHIALKKGKVSGARGGRHNSAIVSTLN